MTGRLRAAALLLAWAVLWAAGPAAGATISGLLPSLDVSPANSINVSAGTALGRDGTLITLAAGMSKIPGAWASGGGHGALDRGTTLAASSGYHIDVIYNPGTTAVDILWSQSALNPELPSGYTKFRRIGGFITDGSANIRAGTWLSDGTFNLTTPFIWLSNLNISAITYGLQPMPVPAGVKQRVKLNVAAADVNPLPYALMLGDPDAGTLALSPFVPGFAVVPAAGLASPANVWTDAAGQIYVGAHDNRNLNITVSGWFDAREDAGAIVNVAIVGASLSMDRNANNWPIQMASVMQAGKQTKVQTQLFGKEGTASTAWISSGYAAAAAAQRPDAVLIDITPDANSGQGISTSTSQTNMLAIIDAIRVRSPSVPIYMLTMNHMRSDATQFANVLDYYALLPTIAGLRSNVSIIDCYTPWGDPALRPWEYAAGDPIHPLFPGNARVTIPVIGAALAPLVP